MFVRRFAPVVVVVVATMMGVPAAQATGANVRLTNDDPSLSGYTSDYTLVTGTPYTDAVLSACSQSRGRQNEPAVAVDPRNPDVIVGSSNDYCPVFNADGTFLGLGQRMNADRDAVLERETSVPGEVVGVRVGLEHADDSDALLVRRREVLLGRVSRIDDDGLVRLLVADEVRRAAEVVVDELPEDHDFRP